jgi:hypothetical protein
MDTKTVQGRLKHEGFSFLTITLPLFCKGFEKSLASGVVDRSLFTGFQFRAGLPLFLGGFLDLVFRRNDGVLLDDPSIDAILAIRQLTLLFSKISLPCSDARIRKAMAGYVECELDVRSGDRSLSSRDLRDFRRVSSLLFARAFTDIDRKVFAGEAVPKHGPGATADSLRGNGKYRQSTWPRRLEEILPSGEFLLPNWRFYDQLQAVDIHEPGSEKPVKVITVPKTMKTPRIIAIEPTAMQYAQQSVLALILESHSKDDFLRRIIGFDDQKPNQLMAQIGSREGTLATLDLSDASDRVSNQLVREMLSPWPWLHKAVDASRSRKADVPGHGVIRLAKFSSMGSALCFPIEAFVFTTLIFIGIERELNTHLDRKALYAFSDSVRIYGDDLIIPSRFVRSVKDTLETFGSRVNVHKSFWTGKFRESCGKDFYDGSDVSVVRVRHKFPTSRKHATEIISLVSLRNQLYFAGYWSTCEWLDREIGKLLLHFPVVLPTSPVLGRHSFLGFETQRTDEFLHSPLVKGWTESSVSPKDPLDDIGALLKCFLMMERREIVRPELGGLPAANEEHLERAGRPYAVDIKLGWASPI